MCPSLQGPNASRRRGRPEPGGADAVAEDGLAAHRRLRDAQLHRRGVARVVDAAVERRAAVGAALLVLQHEPRVDEVRPRDAEARPLQALCRRTRRCTRGSDALVHASFQPSRPRHPRHTSTRPSPQEIAFSRCDHTNKSPAPPHTHASCRDARPSTDESQLTSATLHNLQHSFRSGASCFGQANLSARKFALLHVPQ